MNDSLKIPCTKSFIEKYIVPIKHNIDFDSIKICKINKDGTFGEEVYDFKLIRDALPNMIIPTKQIKNQKYFIKYLYSPKEDFVSKKPMNKVLRNFPVSADLQKHKEIALNLLKNNNQYETAKIIEELFEYEILRRQLFGVWKVESEMEGE